MDIKTLEISKEALEKEINEKQIEINDLMTEMKIKSSFSIWEFESQWMTSYSSSFDFRYKDNKDLQVSYNYETNQIRFSWTSYSYRDMNDDEIVEAQKYIEQVSECLKNLDKAAFRYAVETAEEFLKSEIDPKYEVYFAKKAALEEIVNSIKAINDENEMETIKKFFDENMNKPLYLHQTFGISRAYSSNVITVSKSKKGYDIAFGVYSNKRNVSDKILKELFKHIHKSISLNKGDDNYTKYDNLTNENCEKLNEVSITAEEARSIRRGF